MGILSSWYTALVVEHGDSKTSQVQRLSINNAGRAASREQVPITVIRLMASVHVSAS